MTNKSIKNLEQILAKLKEEANKVAICSKTTNHRNAELIQRYISSRGSHDTYKCRDCGARYERPVPYEEIVKFSNLLMLPMTV